MVVWNPWVEKSKRMTDMEDNGYKNMLCVETANALNDTQKLAPDEEHTLRVTLSESESP